MEINLERKRDQNLGWLKKLEELIIDFPSRMATHLCVCACGARMDTVSQIDNESFLKLTCIQLQFSLPHSATMKINSCRIGIPLIKQKLTNCCSVFWDLYKSLIESRDAPKPASLHPVSQLWTGSWFFIDHFGFFTRLFMAVQQITSLYSFSHTAVQDNRLFVHSNSHTDLLSSNSTVIFLLPLYLVGNCSNS